MADYAREPEAAFEILRAADRRPVPWKNGGGVTTEIAVFPPGAPLDGFEWRVSTARVASDGPFSLFPGVERTLAVLEGEGIELAVADAEPVRIDRHSQGHRFAGDVPAAARLLSGPVDDLNVMTARERFDHALNYTVLQGYASIELDLLCGLVITEKKSRIDGSALESMDAVRFHRPSRFCITSLVPVANRLWIMAITNPPHLRQDVD